MDVDAATDELIPLAPPIAVTVVPVAAVPLPNAVSRDANRDSENVVGEDGLFSVVNPGVTAGVAGESPNRSRGDPLPAGGDGDFRNDDGDNIAVGRRGIVSMDVNGGGRCG